MNQLANRTLFIASMAALSVSAYAAVTMNTFSPNTVVSSAEVNANFQALADKLNALEEVLEITELDGKKTVLIKGANLQIINGEGDTETSNGLGNIIVGYNKASTKKLCSAFTYRFNNETACTDAGHTWAANQRTGSHSVIIGDRHNYVKYGHLIAGFRNSANAAYASVTGGSLNLALEAQASISGGWSNVASGLNSSVSGGLRNEAQGGYSSITGGGSPIVDKGNKAYGYASSITGGANNKTGSAVSIDSLDFGRYTSINGGADNTAGTNYSSIGGGDNVKTLAPHAAYGVRGVFVAEGFMEEID